MDTPYQTGEAQQEERKEYNLSNIYSGKKENLKKISFQLFTLQVIVPQCCDEDRASSSQSTSTPSAAALLLPQSLSEG